MTQTTPPNPNTKGLREEWQLPVKTEALFNVLDRAMKNDKDKRLEMVSNLFILKLTRCNSYFIYQFIIAFLLEDLFNSCGGLRPPSCW